MFKLKLFSGIGAWGVILGGFFAPLTTVCHAQSNVITQFPLTSSAASLPQSLVYAPNPFTNNAGYWFTEFSGQRIGYIDTTSNVLFEISLSASANPFGIVTNGNTIWFTEAGLGRIGYVTNNLPTNSFVDFALPNTGSQPSVIISGPNGLLWFIEYSLNKIAAIDPHATNNGTLTLVHEYGPFRTTSQLTGLAVGADGNIWFTEGSWGIIGRFNPATGVSNEFVLPQTNCEPASIASGPDGALWFAEFGSNTIGRITTNGQITEFPLPTTASYPNPQPYGMLQGRDGNLWFTEYNGSAIGRITPAGVITIFPTPTAPSLPSRLATGPDNNIWFGEYASGGSGLAVDFIGRLLVAQALSLTPASVTLSNNNFNGTLGTFQNSNLTNFVTVSWGDGTNITLLITNSTFATTNLTVGTTTNSLTITSTATNGNTLTYSVTGAHTYSTARTNAITITITDSFNDLATAQITPLVASPKAVGGNFQFSFLTLAGHTNLIQTRTNLNSGVWFTLTNFVGDGTVKSFTYPATNQTSFFRLLTQ